MRISNTKGISNNSSFSNIPVIDIDDMGIDSKFIFCYNNYNSEFKVLTSLSKPIFNLSDRLGNKLELIAIQVDENKYCCKIVKPKLGVYFLKIFTQKSNIEMVFEIKNAIEFE